MRSQRASLRRLFLIVIVLFAVGQLVIQNEFFSGSKEKERPAADAEKRKHPKQVPPESEDLTVHIVKHIQRNTKTEANQEVQEYKNREAPVISDKLRKPRPARQPMNSFISPYHKLWEVNCSEILAGNKSAVDNTNMMLKKLRDENGNLPVPADTEVEKWMTNCSDFKRNRYYPDVPMSDEEEAYPLAYIITTHKEVVQVERLLRSIYQPQNVYCIHPDSKSPDFYQRAIRKLASCFHNVFIASKVESVQYAGYTRLQADINCMADLLKHKVKWKYVLNLCGNDFPLKTNLEITRQLKAYNGHNDINGVIPPPYIAPRTKFHYYNMEGKRPMRTKKRKSPPPHNFTIYFGNAYYAATHEFVQFVVNDQVAVDLLEWSKDTWSPDEHYWVTLQRSPYAPGGYPNATWDANVRFMKWADINKHPRCHGKYVRALCVFGVGYLEYLHRQPHLFANKFHYSYDPVAMQCVEELLDYRTWNPEMSNQLETFPVRNMVWQNYILSTNKNNRYN